MRGLSDADQEIPDIRSRRARVHEIPGGFERGAGIEFAQRAFHVAAREFARSMRAGVDDGAGIRRRRRRCHRYRLPGCVRGSSARSSRARGQREMRIAAAAAMSCGQLHGRFAAPDESVSLASAQRATNSARHVGRVAIETPRRRLQPRGHGHAPRIGNCAHRDVDDSRRPRRTDVVGPSSHPGLTTLSR